MSEATIEWQAGTASSESTVDVAMGEGEQSWAEKAVAGLRMAGIFMWAVAQPVLFAAVVAQAVSTADQLHRESRAASAIAGMKTEQAWLMGQGLADDRRIGVLTTNALGHMPWEAPKGAFSRVGLSVGNIDLAYPLELMAGHWADKRYAISASGQPESTHFGHTVAMSYRHEEGHARAYDKRLRAGPPAAWPKDVSLATLSAMDSITQIGDGSAAAAPSTLPGAWRESWMARSRGEAFADAFAVLSAARRGPGEMARVALAVHAQRVAPQADSMTPTDAAGADHSVEMASFIVGQFDQAKVAKLGAAGLDALAGRVADDSLAWMVARQAPLLGFFEPQGEAWWMDRAKRAGLSAEKASRAWTQWSNDALEAYPAAVFGSFDYEIEGVRFQAKGLDRKLARSAQSRQNDRGRGGQVEALWRYDGAGAVVIASQTDPAIDGHRPALLGLAGNGSMGFRDMIKMLAEDEPSDRMQAALMGAASQQMLLAARLGVDVEEHARWLAKQGDGKSANFSTLARHYAAVMDRYGFPKARARGAAHHASGAQKRRSSL